MSEPKKMPDYDPASGTNPFIWIHNTAREIRARQQLGRGFGLDTLHAETRALLRDRAAENDAQFPYVPDDRVLFASKRRS